LRRSPARHTSNARSLTWPSSIRADGSASLIARATSRRSSPARTRKPIGGGSWRASSRARVR